MSSLHAVLGAALVLFGSRPLHAATAPPPVLINSAHASQVVTKDLLILHPELGSGAGLSAIDNTCGGGTTVAACSTNDVFDPTIIFDTQNTSLANVNVASLQYPVNHAPYNLVNNSFNGYSFTGFGDPATYTQLSSYGVMMSWAFVTAGPSGTPPPITSTTVTATSGPASLSGANWGLEFGIANNYKGFDTSAPSWVTAAMTAVLAAMRVDHPSWSWFDIKAALRQSAFNWATGWDPNRFGYGAIDYDSATALSSTAALYLQPPALKMTYTGTDVTLTLYPFRTARRAYEVVYLVPGTYSFPMQNELTAADIAALVAAGGQLVFIGNSTDATPSGSGTFTPTPGVVYTMVGFTTDGAGAYSRVEAWSRQGTITIPVPGCVCRQQ